MVADVSFYSVFIIGCFLCLFSPWTTRQVGAHKHAVLMLSSVNLPGGQQRMRTYEDQLQMRSFYQEHDLISVSLCVCMLCLVASFIVDALRCKFVAGRHLRQLKIRPFFLCSCLCFVFVWFGLVAKSARTLCQVARAVGDFFLVCCRCGSVHNGFRRCFIKNLSHFWCGARGCSGHAAINSLGNTYSYAHSR